MQAEINNSKEVIKNRMLKHALTYWGIKSTEDLDPAVKLILEALSLELYNLGNEIKDTQVRILEKVANLLAPDFLTSPNPAHAILHVAPVEPVEILTPLNSFFAQLKVSSKQNEVLDTTLDVSFTPVDAVHLFDVQIKYMCTGGTLYAYDASFNKQLVAKTKGKSREGDTLWLALKISNKTDHIRKLAFCFDWKHLEPRLAQQKYQVFPLAKWFINKKEVETVQGIVYPDSRQHNTYESIFLDYDLLALMEKDVKENYQHKFISLGDSNDFNLHESKQTYPSSFSHLFSENDLLKLNESLLWIKVVFPAAMQQDSLDEVYVYPNAFPVMNRQLSDLKYRLKGGSNIIPLRTEMLNQFLSVKSVSDDKHQYKAVPYRKMEEEESGSYTIRNGGVERFDGRNAKELISYLLELLRSESSVFSAYGYDFIATTLKEMNQKISLMEQKTKGYINQAAEIPNYIIIKPFEGHDMMYVEFWTTLAEVANNLRAGTRMQQAKGVKIKPDSIMLMSTTTGGRNRLKPEERLNAFRYGIMTRNRIVTKEDIRNFCYYELGDRLDKVEVERGFELSRQSREAFRRTVDVILIPSEKDNLESASWQTLCEQLKIKLQTRSGVSNDYRVMVKRQS